MTFVSFLAYFILSGMLAPIGIIAGPMATLLDQPITDVIARFSWLTLGNLAGAVLALFMFDWISLKRLLLILYSVILLSLLSFNFSSDLTAIGLALGSVGLCSGLGLAGAALTISRSYNTDKRASMLVITDSFFSVAGIVCGALATWFVAREVFWAGTYQVVAAVSIVVLILVSISEFPSTTDEIKETSTTTKWPLTVWLCLTALFLYTLGQYSMLWWLPNYAETQLGATPEQAGNLVGLFWQGMLAAAIFVSWWVLKIGVRRLVIIASVGTALFSIPLWLYGDIEALPILAFLWGFANLSMLKMTLSFATQMVDVPTPRLVSALLLGATLGTGLSPIITSQIVAATNNYFILQFSTICYAALAVLLISATRIFKPS
ncbi:MAG: MFS transporter TsgA [Woeseia sp.]|nr:MFS transporter TsgA [Woeseia sp.]